MSEKTARRDDSLLNEIVLNASRVARAHTQLSHLLTQLVENAFVSAMEMEHLGRQAGYIQLELGYCAAEFSANLVTLEREADRAVGNVLELLRETPSQRLPDGSEQEPT